MFARTKKVKSGDREYHYVQIVEAYRDNGRPKQRVVANLGRFRDLEDVIEGRPIFHPEGDQGGSLKNERVEAHIFVATLALFLKRTLEHQLATTLPELSSTDALAAVMSIGIAELNLNGQTTRLVSGGGRDARRVLTALGIKDLQPPSPEKGGKDSQM